MDYHREIVNFNVISHGLVHITYSETCVNVNDGNACMGQLFKNWQHSLISREMSGIAVDSYSLVNLNLYAITVYTLEEHCSMILGIVGEFPMDFHREIMNFNAYCLDLNHVSHYI